MKRRKLAALFMAAMIGSTAILSVPAMAEESNVEEALETLEEGVEEAASDALEEAEETVDALQETAEEAEAEFEEIADTIEEGLADLEEGETPFKDLLNKRMEESIEKTKAQYSTYLEQLEQAKNGSSGKISLSLDETGKAFLGMYLPVDLSWLNSLDMGVDVTLKDSLEVVNSVLGLNGTDIANIFVQYDFSNWDVLMAIPDLAAGYLKMNYMDMMDETMEMGGGAVEGVNPTDLLTLIDFSKFSPEYLPDEETLERMLRKYVGIIFDAYQEGGVSQEQIELSDLSEEMTAYCGILDQQHVAQMAVELFTEARDDEDIKDLITTFAKASEDGEDPYASFQNAIDEALSEMNVEEATSEDTIQVILFENAAEEIAGAEVDFVEGADASPILYCVELNADEKKEGYIESVLGDMQFQLYDNLTVVDGVSNGYAEISLNGTHALNVDIVDYSASEDGTKMDGTFALSVPAQDPQTDDYFAMMLAAFSNFGITLDMHTDGTASNCALTLTASGSPLGTLSFDAGLGEGAEAVDPDSLEAVYDMSDEEQMNAYASGLDFSTVLSRLAEAGMPEELINGLLASMTGAAE